MIMKDDHMTHNWWKLGRVIELIKGRDNQVRGARVQVMSTDKKTSILCRSIQHLVPIEVTFKDLTQTI